MKSRVSALAFDDSGDGRYRGGPVLPSVSRGGPEVGVPRNGGLRGGLVAVVREADQRQERRTQLREERAWEREILSTYFRITINLLSTYYQLTINLLSIYYQLTINLLSTCEKPTNISSAARSCARSAPAGGTVELLSTYCQLTINLLSICVVVSYQ